LKTKPRNFSPFSKKERNFIGNDREFFFSDQTVLAK